MQRRPQNRNDNRNIPIKQVEVQNEIGHATNEFNTEEEYDYVTKNAEAGNYLVRESA